MAKLVPHGNPAYLHAHNVVMTLRDAGFVAYFVGGCVRDWMLGHAPKDVDVVTNALPERVEALFPRTRAVGKAFGVIMVHHESQPGLSCEVATFRSDGEYHDGRRPDSVTFGNEEADAARRDFTINGLFYDPLAEKVIDYVGGAADLHAGVVRAIGDPDERFGEDRLRMLRAIRFAARFAFEIETNTWQAIQANAAAIKEVSWERISAELEGMLARAGRGRAMQMLFDAGLGEFVLPELNTCAPQPFGQMLGMLDMIDNEAFSPALAWAVLLWPLAQAECRSCMQRLRLSKETAGAVQAIQQSLEFPARLHLASLAELKRFLRQPEIEGVLALYGMRVALGDGTAKALAFLRRELHRYSESAARGDDLLNPRPLLVGNDLIEMGAMPGPRFKEILAQVEEAQLNETLQSREAALQMARSLLAESSQG